MDPCLVLYHCLGKREGEIKPVNETPAGRGFAILRKIRDEMILQEMETIAEPSSLSAVVLNARVQDVAILFIYLLSGSRGVPTLRFLSIVLSLPVILPVG